VKRWLPGFLVLFVVAAYAAGVFDARPSDPEAAEPTTAPGSGDARGTLVLVAIAGTAAQGRVAFALYDDARAHSGRADALRSAFADLDSEGRATWRLEGLAYGDYGVKAYHDANGNGTLDKGAFGVPTEAYGFSRNARGRFGPPAFEDVRFGFASPDRTLEIRLSK